MIPPPTAVGDLVASGSLMLALPVALAAGLISFFSPCILPLVPGYLSYATGLTGAQLGLLGEAGELASAETPARRRRGVVVLGTLGFVAGFSLVFVSYGALFGGLGAALARQQVWLTRVLGVVVIIMGLGFLGHLPWLEREARWLRRPTRGLAGAPALGVLFGLGWTPCLGPTLATVQALALTQGTAARGAFLSLAYCAGLGLPFLGIGLAFERWAGTLAWVRRHHRAITLAGGWSLVAIGVLLVTGLWSSWVAGLQGWLGGWRVPL